MQVIPRAAGGWQVLVGAEKEAPEKLPRKVLIGGVLCFVDQYDADDGSFLLHPEAKGTWVTEWEKGTWVRGGNGVEMRAQGLGVDEVDTLRRGVQCVCHELDVLQLLRAGYSNSVDPLVALRSLRLLAEV